jgi:hypothetical protein
MLRRCVLVFVATSFFWGCNWGSSTPTDSGTPVPLPLDLGERAAAGTVTLPTAGGEVTVADGALAGLSLRVPPGAWGADVPVQLAATPVNEVRIDGVRAGSVLISLDVGAAGFAAAPVHVFIPGEGTEDEVAMVFGYSRDTGELEAMPSYPSPGGTTFVTQHFSEYLTLLTQKVKLNVDLATPFQYGVDDFPMVNEGSYLEPGGFCSGQVVSAITYFIERRLDGGRPLVEYADERPPDAGPSTRATQAFYSDDRRAWQLTSTVQHESVFRYSNWDKWKDLQQHANPSLTDQLTSAALYVTKRPQLLDVRRFTDGGDVGHALLVFGKARGDAGMRYLVSDPNWPWRADAGAVREVVYLGADAGYVPYSGRQNSTDTTRQYTQFAFIGTWAFVDREAVRLLWDRFDENALGDGFPEVRLVAKQAAIPGNPEVALSDGLVRTDPRLDVGLNPEPFHWRITIVDPTFHELASGNKTITDSVAVTLRPGDNVLGVRVDGRQGTVVQNFSWADFRWVTVRYQAPEPGQPVVLGSLALTDRALGVEVHGTTAYVLLEADGLAIVDVSSPASPMLLSQTDVGAHSTNRGAVVTDDGYAFLGIGSFKIADVRNPLAPAVLSGTGFNANCGRMVVRGTQAFVGCGSLSYVRQGLLGIVDVSDAGSGAINRGLGTIQWSRTVRDVALSADGKTAFLLGSGGSVAAFDVTNPAAPGTTPLSSLSDDGTTPFGLDLEGTTLFAAAGKLHLANVANPAAITWLGEDPYRDVRDVDAVGTVAVAVGVYSSGTTGALWLYDVSNPSAPTVTKTLQFTNPATAVKVVGNRAFVTTTTSTGGGELLVVGF